MSRWHYVDENGKAQHKKVETVVAIDEDGKELLAAIDNYEFHQKTTYYDITDIVKYTIVY